MADLLYTAVIEKYIGEQFDEEFEFSGFIPESTNVNSAVVLILDSSGVDVTDVRKVAQSISGTVVTVSISTGTVETGYVVRVTATSTSNVPAMQSKLLNVTAPGVYR